MRRVLFTSLLSVILLTGCAKAKESPEGSLLGRGDEYSVKRSLSGRS